MGVLDVGVHLRHRQRHQENFNENPAWEDELFDLSSPPSEETETPSNRNQIRRHAVKYSHSHGHRNKKGRKSKRRYENTCFLLSLADHEELEVLEISDFVNTTKSMFAKLFTNNESMKVWDDFINMSEEEQEKLLSGASSKQEEGSGGCETAEDRQLTKEDAERSQAKQPPDARPLMKPHCSVEEEQQSLFTLTRSNSILLCIPDLVASAEALFLTIDKKIRSTLSNKQFPLGTLKYFEEELISCFTDNPDIVLVSLVPSSFDRLLVHGLCQYLKLFCSTGRYGKMRHLEIESKGRFVLPLLLLSQYLEQKR